MASGLLGQRGDCLIARPFVQQGLETGEFRVFSVETVAPDPTRANEGIE